MERSMEPPSMLPWVGGWRVEEVNRGGAWSMRGATVEPQVVPPYNGGAT